MKLKMCFVCVLALLIGSCEPFLISPFPGFLPDLVASRDLSGMFGGKGIERYELCTLNNTVDEYVFLLAYYYDGTRQLLIYRAGDLSWVGQIPNDGGLGSRHFVDLAGNFIIGSVIVMQEPGYTGDPPSAVYGPDGFGAVINGENTLIESYGMGVNLNRFDNNWANGYVSPIPYTATGTTASFNLLYARSFNGLDLTSIGWAANTPASVLVFRDENWDNNNSGFAVVIMGDPGSALMNGGGASHPIPLGPTGYEAWVMSEGIVYRTRDGALKLRAWNGADVALTRDVGPSGKVLMDYGYKDYYYIFDPASLKLYKARDWWVK